MLYRICHIRFESVILYCCWVERKYHPSLISSGISGSTPETAIEVRAKYHTPRKRKSDGCAAVDDLNQAMPDWSNGSDASFSARRREFNSPIGYYMAPSTNRHRSSPFQGGNGSSSLLGATVAVAELVMQRIVVPRAETLNVGSNPIDHPKHAYNIIFRSKRQM